MDESLKYVGSFFVVFSLLICGSTIVYNFIKKSKNQILRNFLTILVMRDFWCGF